MMYEVSKVIWFSVARPVLGVVLVCIRSPALIKIVFQRVRQIMKNAEQILSNNEKFNNVNQNVTDEDKNELPVCTSSHHLDQERFDILEQNNDDGDSHVEQLSTRSKVDQQKKMVFLKILSGLGNMRMPLNKING
ncbi:hypothetical protein FQA39_LY13424 [Lamprigera yunnana]|nr:hypothetical protein FQA39_LY13424 [Lamprigera yunnana]